MPDRLTALLQEQADNVPVPIAPAGDVIALGRSRRRRRRAACIAVGLSTLVTAVAIAAVAVPTGNSDNVLEPADVIGLNEWGAVAVGRDVYVGDAHVRWDEDITAMYYTSEGVVVRSNGEYSMIRADGETSAISIDIPDRIPGFEPDSTRFAYALESGSALEIVVHDAATDKELARVAVPKSATWGGWEAPSVAIDGGVVWMHLDSGWVEADWHTGKYRQVPGTRRTHELANGRYAVQSGDTWSIRDMADSSVVGTVDLRRGWYAFFSPDGRFLRSFPNMTVPEKWSPEIHDPAAGTKVVLDDPGDDFGWTPEGDLLVVGEDQLRVCSATSGKCRTRAFDRGHGDLRIGGNPYES
jgi:hypothetical protein